MRFGAGDFGVGYDVRVDVLARIDVKIDPADDVSMIALAIREESLLRHADELLPFDLPVEMT